MQEKQSTAKADRQGALQGPFTPNGLSLDCSPCDTYRSSIYYSNCSPAKKPMPEQTQSYKYQQVGVILDLRYQVLEVNVSTHLP